jgi:formate-dependent nitrite reductase cytochrome c552 subunit
MGAGKGTKTSGAQGPSQAKDKAKAGGKNLVRNSGSQDKDRNPESQADREKAINDVLTKIDNTLQDFNKKKSGGKVDATKAIDKDMKKTS